MNDKKYIIALYGKQWNREDGSYWYYGGSRLSVELFFIPVSKLSKAKTHDTFFDAQIEKDKIDDSHEPIIVTVTKKQLFIARLKGK